MITEEHKEKLPRNCEASIKCLQGKAYSYSLQYNGNYVEGLPELRNVINFQQRAGIVEREPNVSLSSESPNKGYHIHQRDFCTWSAFHPNFQKLPNQWNAFDSQFYAMNLDYPFPIDHQYPYMPWKIFPHGHPNEFQFQEFQYFVVIDFEATCDKERTPHPQEIIEFPSVIVNSMTGEQEAIFQTYVRPTCNQLLTDFCKDLTGIQQIQVDRGVTLSEALLMHDKWLESKGIKHTNFAVVTWSNWDCRVMLESECRFKRIRKPPYFNKWINLKVPFHEVFGGVRCNLKEAVQLAGLAWEGRAHCGLDDAMNTARLLTLLMRGASGLP